MKIIICVDFGSTYTKVTAIDVKKELIIASEKSITTIGTSIMEGYNLAYNKLISYLPEEFEIIKRLGCSSAAGGLKMVVVGNVPELTADAAKKAALGAGARVLKTYHFDLSLDEIEEIKSIDADMVLLAGGTDGGNKEYIVNNSKILANNNIKIPIVVAGNKSAQFDIMENLKEANCDFYITENIMPQLNKLNIEPVRNQIREVFMNTIINAKGLSEAINLVDNEIIPTPLSILNAAKSVSLGSDTEDGIGELIVVDIGGATTDIHSIAKGLPSRGDVVLKGMQEPLDKRTVEGDLGMRYSASSLLESVQTRQLSKMINKLGFELDNNTIKNEIELRANNIEKIPETTEEKIFDRAMAMCCTKESLNRHAGFVERGYSAFGETYNQKGKDLTTLNYIIGTGGVIVHSDKPSDILKEGLYSNEEPSILKPIKPEMLLDHKYVLSALGLLTTYNNDMAVRIIKKYLKKVEDN